MTSLAGHLFAFPSKLMDLLVFRHVILGDSLKADLLEKLLFFSFCWQHDFRPVFTVCAILSANPVDWGWCRSVLYSLHPIFPTINEDFHYKIRVHCRIPEFLVCRFWKIWPLESVLSQNLSCLAHGLLQVSLKKSLIEVIRVPLQ